MGDSMSDENVAILIDNMYLDHLCNAYGINMLDIQKIPQVFLREGEKHYKTYIFDALPFVPPRATQEQIKRKEGKKRFLDAIAYYDRTEVDLGYVSKRHAQCPECDHDFFVPVQKLVDVKLSVRLVSLAWETTVDKIVLITGDGDIQPAVRAIEKTGTIVRLAYGLKDNVYTNKGLIKCCPEKHLITRDDLINAAYDGKQ